MIAAVWVTAAILAVTAALAVWVYARAVTHGHRMYVHVVLALAYVAVVTVVAALAAVDEPPALQVALAASNIVGVAAMRHAVGRFRGELRAP